MIAIDTALFLAEYLQRSGVRRVYVVPDRDVATVLNALRLRGLEVIPTNQPTSGALLAAAESAVHGGTGVIVSGAGPS
ncbi:MAG: thiamine pyrophosphate-binding protein, partial [Thermomicrobiaceae bacterium]|nr:thiamine pyrophosphate-binding protein [Thermomicrobiaceae bacterium]